MEIINYLKRNNGSGHIVEHVGWHESGDYLLRQLFEQSEQRTYRQHKYDVEKEYNVIDKAEVDALERQTCSRRMQEFGPWSRTENMDFWKPGDQPNSRKCSFCGSLHPDDVIARIKEHGLGIIQRTTKSYKWYVDPGYDKYYHMHNTEEFIETFNGIVKNQAS